MSGVIAKIIFAYLITVTSFTEGSLSRYDPGVMDRNLTWRHTNGIPSGFSPYQEKYEGHIAVADCKMVGKDAWLTVTIDRVEMDPILVYISDCTNSPNTLRWMRNGRIVAELDWETWDKLGIKDGSGAWGKLEIIGD